MVERMRRWPEWEDTLLHIGGTVGSIASRSAYDGMRCQWHVLI